MINELYNVIFHSKRCMPSGSDCNESNSITNPNSIGNNNNNNDENFESETEAPEDDELNVDLDMEENSYFSDEPGDHSMDNPASFNSMSKAFGLGSKETGGEPRQVKK